MYEYKFVTVDVSLWKGKPKEDHHEIIEKHARDGWRLVQILVIPFGGAVSSMELIFERPR